MLLNRCGSQITDEMVEAARTEGYKGKEIAKLLLSRREGEV